MLEGYSDILSMEFSPLSEVKAKFSEQINKTQRQAKRVVVTINGRPAGVLMSYEDYLGLVRKIKKPEASAASRVLDYKEWRRGDKNREKIRDSVLNLFDMTKLSRKGQKAYKKETVREFEQRIKKRTAGRRKSG